MEQFRPTREAITTRTSPRRPPTPPPARRRTPTPPPPRKKRQPAIKVKENVKKTVKERPYAQTDEEIKMSRDLFDAFYLLGQEHAHCEKYPRFYSFEESNDMFRCLLCNKLVAQAHLNSETYRYKFEYPAWYGHSHDRDVPLPREPETRKKHRELDAKPQKASDGDRPHLWEQTILERRLHLDRITMKEFKEQHPLGEGAEPRVMHEDQEYGFGEYIAIRDVESYKDFNGAVAMITSYDPEHRDYVIAFVGLFRGYHFINIWPTKFAKIPTEEVWQALYRKDPKLYKDVQGVDYGPPFLKADTKQQKKIAEKQSRGTRCEPKF